MGPISLRRNIRVALLTCKIWKLGIFLVDYFVFERYTVYIRDGVCLLVLEGETLYIWERLFLFGKDTLSFIFERETLYIWDKDSVFRFERETLDVWGRHVLFVRQSMSLYIWRLLMFERQTHYVRDIVCFFILEKETLHIWERDSLFLRDRLFVFERELYIWERDSLYLRETLYIQKIDSLYLRQCRSLSIWERGSICLNLSWLKEGGPIRGAGPWVKYSPPPDSPWRVTVFEGFH